MSETISLQDLGQNLRRIRRGLRLRQSEVAKALGYARTTIIAIEKGERRLKVDELKAFADFYALPVEFLMSGHLAIGQSITRESVSMQYVAVTPAEVTLLEAFREGSALYLVECAAAMLRKEEQR